MRICYTLPRTPHVFEEQLRWPLDSIEEHADFARAKFEEDIAEGDDDQDVLRDLKARYGEHRAIAALAVIVEDEAIGKKRMTKDATHGVRVNHRIRCRDKIRAPGARRRNSYCER